MGFWTITIKGSGPHHNRDYSGDADRMAAQFVKELQSNGQNIETAQIETGVNRETGVAMAIDDLLRESTVAPITAFKE